MRIFLTGGSGLVGRHTVGALCGRGDRVLALSRTEASDAALRALGAEPLRGDLGDEDTLERGVAETDATVHAAAIVLSRRADWPTFHAANVAPTETLARSCARRGRRLVHLSSVAVYGRATTYAGGAGSVTEEFGLDRPVFPGDHYARSKREAERAVWRAAEDGLSAIALRPCVIYGEGDRAFAPRVARMLRRGFAPLIGGGGNTLSVVYAGNVAAAVTAALDRPGVTGPFNVTNDGAITLRGFIERFAAGLGTPVRLLPVPRPLAWNVALAVDAVLRRLRPAQSMTLLKTAVQFLSSDNPYLSGKAERELGWRPVIGPADAVERTGRWFRAA